MTKQYEIGEEIFDNIIVLGRFGGEGKSGFGVVYLVVEKTTGFTLALKTLQKDNISISDFNKFKEEIIPWIELSHPHIVKAFSIDLDDNKRPYLLMEPVFPDEHGRQNLTDFMNNELSEEQVLIWSIQFCYAMDYVNKQGLIHGDIKPDNILISREFVKITDFGLVKSINDQSKDYYGTPFYLAPESWEGTKNVQSEIYAFGMVLYQMVNSGTLPFDGLMDCEWENFHKNGKIPKLDSDLYPFIEKCLEKNPKDRYSSFNELNNDLMNFLDKKFNKRIDEPELEDIGNIENLNQGHLAAILGNVKNCKHYYEIAIANSNNNKSYIYNYALDLILLHEYEDALKQLEKLTKDPDSIPLDRIYFNIGKCYHEGICLYKSIKYYKKAIEINNYDLKAHTNLGNVYKEYGFFEEALIEYKFVLNQNPCFPQALLNIVDLFDKLDNEEKFKEYSEKLNSIQQNPQINYYSGVFLKKQNILKFLTSMDNATEEYNYQIQALIQLFEFHLNNGNLSEANLKFDEIFKLTDDVDLLTELCFTYKKYDKYEEALIKIDYIYNNLEKYKEYALLKKSSLIKEYELNTAIEICNSLINEKYDNEFKSKVYITLGNLFLKINPKISLEYFLKSYELDSKNIFSLLNISSHYANNGDYEIAEQYIDKGLIINKTHYDLLFNKARLCQDQFKYDEAIIYYNKCLKINPTNEVYGLASYCFIELGMIEQSGMYSELAMNISEENEYLNYLILYLPFLIGFDIE